MDRPLCARAARWMPLAWLVVAASAAQDRPGPCEGPRARLAAARTLAGARPLDGFVDAARAGLADAARAGTVAGGVGDDCALRVEIPRLLEGPGDALILEWETADASRLTVVTWEDWQDRGAPPVLAVRPPPRVADPLEGRPAPRPRPLVDSQCPGDLAVECDGAGNVVDRDAWLAQFRATTDVACGTATTDFEITPEIVLGTIRYDDFSDVSTLTLNGATAVIGNPVFDGRWVLRLTSTLTQSGSAFVTQPVTLAADASFNARFSFRISNPQGSSDLDGVGADGLAFVVQTVANTAGGAGGGIGYQGIVNSVAVELDTWDNGFWDDYDGNHVGIDLNGDVDSRVQAPVRPRLNDGDVWYAWVDYDGTSDLLEVRLAQGPWRPPAPQLTLVVDAFAVLGGTSAYVGFTSGTGAGGGFHDILTFHFDNTGRSGGCGGARTDRVVATFRDDCGDIESCTRSFVVADTQAPAITPGGAAPCFADLAAAEAAVLAASTAVDACTGPEVLLASATAAGCDGTVRLDSTDACGNSSSVQVPVRLGASPPLLAPADADVACGGVLWGAADASGWGRVTVGVTAVDDCPDLAVSNDRTLAGADATGDYPCGMTWVQFDALDACGGAASCRIAVLVVPDAPPPDVGPALRVTKDAAARPRLDWRLTGAGALSHAVLVHDPELPAPELVRVAGTAWTDGATRAPLTFYDVRSIDCSGAVSAD